MVILGDVNTGPEKRKQFQAEKEDMELRQSDIAEAMEIDLRGYEEEDDREKSFDLLVAGYYR